MSEPFGATLAAGFFDSPFEALAGFLAEAFAFAFVIDYPASRRVAADRSIYARAITPAARRLQPFAHFVKRVFDEFGTPDARPGDTPEGQKTASLLGVDGASEVRVAQIIRETDAEGPGCRFAVWVQGCPMRCRGCCNPTMLLENSELPGVRWYGVAELLRGLAESAAEGVTLLGGEPFAQPAALARFAEGAQGLGRSVMIFTGFTLAELRARRDPATEALLSATDLLVDGRYDDTQRSTDRRFIGSANQVLHFLSSRYDPLDPRLHTQNHLEIRVRRDHITLNGWPIAGVGTAQRLLDGAARRPRGQGS